jgi:hypothetical protein
VGFNEWLRTQEGGPTPIGDLANDASQDPKFPESDDLDAHLRHLDAVGAPELVRNVLRRANARWRAESQ